MRHPHHGARDPFARPAAIVLLLACGIVLPAIGHAGDRISAGSASGAIHGMLRSGDGGAPLPGVRVLLLRAPAANGASAPATHGASAPAAAVPVVTTSDAEGRFRFERLPPGRYTLLLEHPGHAPRSLAGIEVPPSGTVPVAESLVPVSTVRVTVFGGAAGHGVSGPSRQRFDARAMKERPAALDDPFRAMAGAAGLASQNDFTSEIRIRGGQAADTAVLLDGLPLPRAYHFAGGAGSVGAVSGGLLQEAEVMAGGFSVEHGDVLAGVIELTTSESRPGALTGSGSLSSVAGQAWLAGPAGSGDFLMSARGSDLGLYEDHVGEEGMDDLAFHDLLGRYRVYLPGGGRVTFGMLRSNERYEQAIGDGETARLDGGQSALRASIEAPLDAATFLRLGLADSGRDGRSEVSGGAAHQEHLSRRELRGSILRLLGDEHRLTAGFDLALESGVIEGTVYQAQGLVPGLFDATERTSGLFVEDLWRPTPSWALRYGVRADRFSEYGSVAVSPRASLRFGDPEGLSFSAAAGRFVQFPRPEQIFLAAGAGDGLQAQIGEHLIVGVDRRWQGGFRLLLEAYRKSTRDAIGEAINRYVDLPELLQRFDRADHRGVELTLERAGTGPWRLRLDYSFLVAELRDAGVTIPAGTDQRHAANLLVGRRLGRGWDLSAVARYGTGLPYTPLIPWTNGLDYSVRVGELNAVRLPAYHRLDLRLSRALPTDWGHLDLFVELLNVLNRENVRSVEVTRDPLSNGFIRTVDYQAPFLPVFGIAASF